MGKLVGWIVAAILLLAGTGVLIWGMGQRMVADDLRARLERADGTINALKENLEAMGRRVDAAAQETLARVVAAGGLFRSSNTWS